MIKISMKELLEAGVHFGHQTKRWNPKMKRYIFGERNGIYVIDLQQTLKHLKDAARFVTDIVAEGKEIIFVGTKKQAQDAIKREAERCGMFYVNQRWLGGTLTNFATIRKSVEHLRKLDDMKNDGIYDALRKKEVLKLEKERVKMEKILKGIKDMSELPGALFVVDPRKEDIAVTEARKLEIPVIAIVDTNCNPEVVDYVIPGNDDAIRSVSLISAKIADAVLEGKEKLTTLLREQEKPAEQPQPEAVPVEVAAKPAEPESQAQTEQQ